MENLNKEQVADGCKLKIGKLAGGELTKEMLEAINGAVSNVEISDGKIVPNGVLRAGEIATAGGPNMSAKIRDIPGGIINAKVAEPGADFITNADFEAAVVKQSDHWLYTHANMLEAEAEAGQNEKAAAKYPEPLNPANWSGRQLVRHGMEELVDLKRYLAALDCKFSQQEAGIQQLKWELKQEKEKNKQLVNDNVSLERQVRKAFGYGR
jgi:hypothetical protein